MKTQINHMNFEEAIKNDDVIRHAKHAMKKYATIISPENRKSIMYYAIWRACEKFNGKSSFLTYVYNRARFACKDFLKTVKRDNQRSQVAFDTNVITDKSVINNDTMIIEVLESIKSEKNRNIIKGIYLDNTPIESLSKEFNISEKSILNIVKKEIEKIKKEYIK